MDPIRTTEPDNRSVADLLRELRDETTLLVRQEIALAKTEMSEKASRAGRNLGYLGAGAVIAASALVILLFGLSALCYVGLVEAGVSNMTAGWAAPLIVGAIAAIIGYALVQKAISTLRDMSVVPQQTVKTLKEDKQWLQQKAAT